MKHTESSICFVAGKSGGHIVPCLALARTQFMNEKAYFITTNKSLDTTILKTHDFKGAHYTLPLQSAALTSLPLKLWTSVLLVWSFVQSLFLLMRIKPKKIISTGGIIGIPVCLAAKILGIPIDLYDLDACPGKASQMIAKMGAQVHVCFKTSARFFNAQRCVLTAYPTRFTTYLSSNTIKKISEAHGLTDSRFTLLILGGSQGSQNINRLILETLTDYPELRKTLQIIHQAGGQDLQAIKDVYNQYTIPHLVFSYTDIIDIWYSKADLALCRSGAGTLFELIFFKTPCITIPLETQTTSHQKNNAYALAQEYPNLVTVLEEKNASSATVAEILRKNLEKYDNPPAREKQELPDISH